MAESESQRPLIAYRETLISYSRNVFSQLKRSCKLIFSGTEPLNVRMLHQGRSVTLRSEFWLGEPYILKHGMKIAEVLLMLILQVPMKFRVCRVCKSSHNKRCTPVILKDSTEACLLQGENSLQRLLSPPLLSLKMYLDCYCWQSKKAHTLGP